RPRRSTYQRTFRKETSTTAHWKPVTAIASSAGSGRASFNPTKGWSAMSSEPKSLNRRTVLRGAAATAALVPLTGALAACAGGGDDDTSGGSTPSSGGGADTSTGGSSDTST